VNKSKTKRYGELTKEDVNVDGHIFEDVLECSNIQVI
jgi:hypothetical protein